MDALSEAFSIDLRLVSIINPIFLSILVILPFRPTYHSFMHLLTSCHSSIHPATAEHSALHLVSYKYEAHEEELQEKQGKVEQNKHTIFRTTVVSKA